MRTNHGKTTCSRKTCWSIDRLPGAALWGPIRLPYYHAIDFMKKIAVIGVPGGWSSEVLTQRVKDRTGQGWLVDLESVALDLDKGRVFNSEVDLADMDAVIIKKAGPSYSPHLLDRLEMLRFMQARGLKCFSDPFNIMRTLDRTSCTVTLRAGNIPMPPTLITESVDMACAFVQESGRAVCKPLYSTKARGMRVVGGEGDTRAAIEEFKADNDVMYLQRMVELPGRDMAVAFLGGGYLATYARVGNGDSWNTTTRSGGAYEACDPGQEIIDMAHRAQSLFDLDFTCVDVAETPDGPVVFEVSAFGGFRGLRDANGLDMAALYVDYVLERI